MSMQNEDSDYNTLRIFTLLFVNSFLIGAAVAIHQQGLWFPAEENWFKVGGLYMMAATFVQMVSFMLYKSLMSQSRRNMKKMNAELQRFQMSLEMEGQRRRMEDSMQAAKDRMENSSDVPLIQFEA